MGFESAENNYEPKEKRLKENCTVSDSEAVQSITGVQRLHEYH